MSEVTEQEWDALVSKAKAAIQRIDDIGLIVDDPNTLLASTVVDAVLPEFDRMIERVRAEERERLIGNLRWLAKSRAEYCRLPHADEDAAIRAYHESSRLMQVLHDEHTTAEAIADLLDGSNDGMGWLPSWRWDEWRAIRAVSEQEETA